MCEEIFAPRSQNTTDSDVILYFLKRRRGRPESDTCLVLRSVQQYPHCNLLPSVLLKNAIKQGSTSAPHAPWMPRTCSHHVINKGTNHQQMTLVEGGQNGCQTHAEDSIDFAVHCADFSQFGKKVTGADGHA